jgi:hypothetical protein
MKDYITVRQAVKSAPPQSGGRSIGGGAQWNRLTVRAGAV